MARTPQMKAGPNPGNYVGYDLGMFSRLKMMLSIFLQSSVRYKIVTMIVLLLVIILVTAYVQVLLNRWNAPFYDALSRRDMHAFLHQLRIFLVIGGALLVLNVIQAWLNQMSALFMREGLARDLVDEWLKNGRALKLGSAGLLGVNPDQRLHEDARNLAENSTSLAIELVQSTILLVSFIGVLWQLSSGFVFHVHGKAFAIPGYMVWAALVYALSASFLSQIVGGRLVPLSADRYSKEAELRFSLMNANEHIPSITVAGGEENERRRINAVISTVLLAIRKLAIANTNLTWVSAGYGWIVIVIPILVAAPAYFSGSLSFGQLMMAVGAFTQVNAALRWYVANFRPIAEWKATLIRVTDFRQALLDMDDQSLPEKVLDYRKADQNRISISKLELSPDAANGETTNDFHLTEQEVDISPGENVMINSDNGLARRLLFQAFGGRWRSGSGALVVPQDKNMLFVPQRIYIPGGSLREALSFPEDPTAYADASYLEALEKVGLHRLKDSLDRSGRWDHMLETDERKAVAFAHILLSNPDWLILDETLEGLQPEVQLKMADLLAELRQTGIVYIGNSEVYLKRLAPRLLHLEPVKVAATVAPEEVNPVSVGKDEPMAESHRQNLAKEKQPFQ